MSENHSAIEEAPGILKAFANAGIVDEPPENENNDTQTGSDTTSGNSTATEGNKSDKVAGEPGKDSLGSTGDATKKPGKEKEAKVTDNPGDLKLADGTVVKAGAERRHYETAQITKQRLTLAQSELNTEKQNHANLKTKYDELSQTVSKIGMEKPEDVSAAVTLYKDLTRDPQGTMVKLLAEMKALGHTFEGIGGQIDTAALQNLLDARLPKPSQEQQRPTQEEVNEQATKDVAKFVAEFPDAITHEAHIAALIDRSVAAGKPLSLTDAYFALKERVTNDGLDWGLPLGPQLEARKPSQQQQQQPKPRANGRTDVAASIDPAKVIQPERELDSDSIVRAAMQEAGFNLK